EPLLDADELLPADDELLLFADELLLAVLLLLPVDVDLPPVDEDRLAVEDDDDEAFLVPVEEDLLLDADLPAFEVLPPLLAVERPEPDDDEAFLVEPPLFEPDEAFVPFDAVDDEPLLFDDDLLPLDEARFDVDDDPLFDDDLDEPF